MSLKIRRISDLQNTVGFRQHSDSNSIPRLFTSQTADVHYLPTNNNVPLQSRA